MPWLLKQSKSSFSLLSRCVIQAVPFQAHCGVCGPSVIRSVKSTWWDALSISVLGCAMATAYPPKGRRGDAERAIRCDVLDSDGSGPELIALGNRNDDEDSVLSASDPAVRAGIRYS